MAESKIVRTIDWKLMVRETGGDELYPVSTDPCERWNLLTSPKHSAVLAEIPIARLGMIFAHRFKFP